MQQWRRDRRFARYPAPPVDAALNIIGSFEKTIVGANDARCKPGRLGTARSCPSPSSALTRLDSTSLPPELRSADVRSRSTPVAWISPDRRVARVCREPSIMCSSQCTERALSRRNEFPSEPVVHNRMLNIEAVMRSCA